MMKQDQEQKHSHIAGPNFQKFTSVFDRYMPLITNVGTAMLSNLPQLQDDAAVLDVACGTGEPGLTLAHDNAHIKIVGIDLAENMATLAREKSLRAGLLNTDYMHMNAEKLTFDDDSFDAVISRFGLGMFGDIEASIKEASRVMKRGGCLSLAVWHDMTRNTFTRTFNECFRKAQPQAEMHALANPTPGARAAELFKTSGFPNLKQAEFTWNYHFDSVQNLRTTIEEMGSFMFAKWLDELSDDAKSTIFASVVEAFQPFKTSAGAYDIPHTCLLLWGRKEQDVA